ncbi:hypothetical protein BJY52DRAFT_822720 [Lactarius psammicola]|nr:hypothetical protein BJY52DRAFT_822720 [Lactarius psammicola]
MPFPFTFSISVPGIMNPFSKSPDLPDDASDPPAPVATNNLQEKRWLAVRRPHPSTLPPPVPLARKRGWQPSSPEPSPAAAVTTSTSGHLNIPPKYRDFTVTPEAREEEEGTEEIAAGESHVHLTDSAYIPSSYQNASRRLSVHTCHLYTNRGRNIKRTCHVYSMLFAHGRHVYAVHTLHPPI